MSAMLATVLLAEDDPNDAFLVKRAFQKAGLEHQIVHVSDGQEAVDYLRAQVPSGTHGHGEIPALLLLDLKMPRLSGFEVLGWIRSRSDLKSMPVVVLSSSDHERDKAQAQELGATDFFRKPNDPGELVELVRSFHARFLQLRPRALIA
jgi:DNA-binding response OmpR family regulator